jgi:hypothetical protein
VDILAYAIARNNVRTKKMAPKYVVTLARTLEACAPKKLSAALLPKVVPNPSPRVLCISTATISNKQTPTWSVRRTGISNLPIEKPDTAGSSVPNKVRNVKRTFRRNPPLLLFWT